jgi:hypothetical protein
VQRSSVFIGCAFRGFQETQAVVEPGSQAGETKALDMEGQMIHIVMIGFPGVRDWREEKEKFFSLMMRIQFNVIDSRSKSDR